MKMKKEELKEINDLLEEAGIRPRWCDTAVPLSGSTVRCGCPTEPGDMDYSEYILLPKSLVGQHPEMFIPAVGDSMRDAGFETDDMLRVRFNVTAHDGDNVLAWIDGQCTVKVLFTDDDGKKWLVPRNIDYDAILLKGEMDVRILGVVVGVEKSSPRASSRTLIQAVRRTKEKMLKARKLTAEEVDERIVRIGPYVQHARQWFAVYKPMAECTVTEEGDYKGFCSRVLRLLPEHEHLPEAKEVARMDVFSFAKPIAMWEESNAPVKGVRFRDYRNIALTMMGYLSDKR
jgi:SOS-response transcriptional repressor LexA